MSADKTVLNNDIFKKILTIEHIITENNPIYRYVPNLVKSILENFPINAHSPNTRAVIKNA